MRKYIALVNNNNHVSHAKVTTTAWDREIGDRVNEMGEIMIVVAVGETRSEVVKELNKIIQAQNEVVRTENKRRKAEVMKNSVRRELTAGEKELIELLKDANHFRKLGI